MPKDATIGRIVIDAGKFFWYKADASKSLHRIKEVRVHEQIISFNQATMTLRRVLDMFAQRGLHDLAIQAPTEILVGNTLQTSFIHHIYCNQDSWNVDIALNYEARLANPHIWVRFSYKRDHAAFQLVCRFGHGREQNKRAFFVLADDHERQTFMNARSLIRMNVSRLNELDLRSGFPLEQFISFVDDLAIHTAMRNSHARSNRRTRSSRRDAVSTSLFDGGE